MSVISERGCTCPEVPCPYHPTPMRSFNELAEAVAEDWNKVLEEHRRKLEAMNGMAK